MIQKSKIIFLNKFFLILCAAGIIFLFLNLNFQPISKEKKFDKVNTFFKVLRLIEENYVVEPNTNSLVEGAISGMINELDPHSIYINKSDYQETNESMDGEFEGIGVEFSIIDDYITVITPIIDGPAYRAGIQSGDQIIKINGESAYQITIPNVLKKLKGPKDTQVEVTISREGNEPFERILIRDKIPLKSVSTHFMIDADIGYIKLSNFSKKTVEEFRGAFYDLKQSGMENLLLDLRNNPGGLLDQAIELLDMFIATNDTLLFTTGRIRGSNAVFRASYSQFDEKLPIITIINRGSASASEIISGTFQDLDRGLVVGETSFGKGSVQQHYDLDNETAARITIAKYHTPSGRSIQRDYKDGDEKYYENLAEENRELSDSSKKGLPQFKTKKGRTVYGGGGINPDVYYIDTLSLSETSIDLIYSPNRYIFNYSESLKKDYQNMAYEDLVETALKKINFNDFIKWLNKTDFKNINEQELNDNWDNIKVRIIAEIANKFLGRTYYYRVLIMNDKTAQESLKYFNEAKTLLN
ncbi:MAG: peptidase [Candidatus Marinimicrobia bacterium]|nr:peptidase [Candidatus Neomarinimicrobiota bacterium]